MAHDLGFDSVEALTHLADMHPTLWGNACGRFMFSSSTAFDTGGGNRPLEVEDLAAHWHTVADRIGAQEYARGRTRSVH